MANVPNLVHEADAQRHHVRVKIPAKAEIDGVSYVIRDWSTAGATIELPAKAPRSAFSNGKIHEARLLFDFAGFSLAVPMKLEVVRAEGDAGAGVRFIDMSQEQIVIMRQLVSSYISGELTSVGELIHVMGRNNFSKARQIPTAEERLSTPERVLLLVKKVSVPLVTLSLLAYVGMAIFEQKFVVKADKAVVTADNVTIASTGGGIVSFKDLHAGDRLKKGDPLLTIVSDTGSIKGVDSPCDCVIEERLVDSGVVVNRGTVMLRLIPMDSPLRVEAFVNYEDAIRLFKGNEVWMKLAGDGHRLSGVVTGISLGAEGGDRAKIFIRPSETLGAEMAGTPVSVKINTRGRLKPQE